MAMTTLEWYVKDLDLRASSADRAQDSETEGLCSSSVEHIIDYYESLARIHGPNIVPHIKDIMSTVIKALTSTAGALPVQAACSKIVPTIADFGMDQSTPLEKRRDIIHSLCKPLSDSLLSSQESLACGAAMCLKALVDSYNWRFASKGIVNDVCLSVAGALDNFTETDAFLWLVMALAKHNNFIVEAYARILIRSGLRILNSEVEEVNTQKRLLAIQMVNSLMKSLDPRSMFSELNYVIVELEKCQSDEIQSVRDAAIEVLETAIALAAEKSPGLRKDPNVVTESKFSTRRDYNRKKNVWNTRGRSSVSLKSHTVDSFIQYDSLAESPMSMWEDSGNFYSRRSERRVLWHNEKASVEGPSGSNCSKINIENLSSEEIRKYEEDASRYFSGFVLAKPKLKVVNCSASSNSEDLYDGNSKDTGLGRRSRIPPLRRYRWNSSRNFKGGGNSPFRNNKDKSLSEVAEQGVNVSEYVPSTNAEPANANQQLSNQIALQDKTRIQSSSITGKISQKIVLIFFCDLLILLVVILSVMWKWNHSLEECSDLTAT